MEVRIKNTSNNPLPEYKTCGSSALDIALSQDCVVKPHKVSMAHTGLFIETPKDYSTYLIARSSLHKKGLMLANSIGVIDSDYRGELLIALFNFTDEEVSVCSGERVAQIMLVPVIHTTLVSVAELSETERGDGGFGSTNKV